MTRTQYLTYANDYGLIFANLKAHECGVCLAQRQLWALAVPKL